MHHEVAPEPTELSLSKRVIVYFKCRINLHTILDVPPLNFSIMRKDITVEIVVIWLFFAILVGFVASQRGRSGFGWFIISLIISPLISVIIIALMPSRTATPSRAPATSTTPAISLEGQIRDRILEEQFAHYIKSYKPPFSGSVVYDVELNGEKRRFRTKAEAMAYCYSRLPAEAPSLDHRLGPPSA